MSPVLPRLGRLLPVLALLLTGLTLPAAAQRTGQAPTPVVERMLEALQGPNTIRGPLGPSINGR